MQETGASCTGADARRAPLGGDEALLAACRGGDERAFVALTGRHLPALCALAACRPDGAQTATRDIGQAWLAVLREERGEAAGAEPERDERERDEPARLEPERDQPARLESVRARVARTLVAAAGARGHETPPTSATSGSGVAQERFFGASHELWPGEWTDPPRPWGTVASRRLGGADVHGLLAGRIGELDVAARASVILCDVHRWTPSECAFALGCPVGEVRASLRRGREALRALLEAVVDQA